MPNTYAFTKSLGEAIVTEQMENIPAIILRPSIGKIYIFSFTKIVDFTLTKSIVLTKDNSY